MPAGSPNDSSDVWTLQNEAAARDDGVASASAPAKPAAAKPRTRRPRPTFDDGALTRVFKFPSKTYPRSSYYVTGDEIIIRIKKARKKWKLVVPKKRLVSYRTNRWFAKPRWVEIELTYTQATRLKLIEPRIVPKEAQADGTPAAVACDLHFTDELAPPTEIENSSGETVLELGPEVVEQDDVDTTSASAETEAAEALACAPDADVAARIAALAKAATEIESAAEAAQELESTASAEPPPTPQSSPPEPEPARIAFQQPTPSAPPLVRSIPETAPIASRRRRNANAAYRAAASLMMVLVVTMASIVGIWLTRDIADEESTGRTACVSLDCAYDIVTGSIAKPEARPAPAPVLPTDPAPVVVEQPEHRTAEIEPPRPPDEITRTPEQTQEEPVPEREPEPMDTAAAMPDSLPAPDASSIIAYDCRDLADDARVLRIRFGYASFKLTSEAQAALNDFAQRLLQCPAVILTISGHTDSEGHADRNRRLSIRRAQAVLKHLAAAGAQPEQLSAVGLGPTQPYLPNTSAENRQQNRRAEVVVAFGR